jgi:hypothetical protein
MLLPAVAIHHGKAGSRIADPDGKCRRNEQQQKTWAYDPVAAMVHCVSLICFGRALL